MLESLFNEVAALNACSVIKQRLQYRRFPAKFEIIFGTPVLENICERTLLSVMAEKFLKIPQRVAKIVLYELENQIKRSKYFSTANMKISNHLVVDGFG